MEPKLYISKPCHEDWSRMTPAERGRHCEVCNKVVKDLTALNKIEAIQVLSNSGETEVCGRVNATILDTAPDRKSRIEGRIKKWGISALAFIGFFFIQKKSWAQGLVMIPADAPGETSRQSTRTTTLFINVLNEDKQPVSYAVVKLTGKNGETLSGLSDANGDVKLVIDEAELGNELDVEVSCMGFEILEMKDLRIRKKETQLGVTLSYKIITMPEFIKTGEREELVFETEGGGTLSRSCGHGDNTMEYAVLGGIGYTTIEISDPGILQYTDENTVKTPDSPPYVEVPLKFTAFPNPTSGAFTIESNKSNTFDLQVLDENGKVLLTRLNVSGREQVDLSEAASGLYYIRLTENGKLLEVKKVIVAR